MSMRKKRSAECGSTWTERACTLLALSGSASWPPTRVPMWLTGVSLFSPIVQLSVRTALPRAIPLWSALSIKL